MSNPAATACQGQGGGTNTGEWCACEEGQCGDQCACEARGRTSWMTMEAYRRRSALARHLWETRATRVSASLERCSKIASSISFGRQLPRFVAAVVVVDVNEEGGTTAAAVVAAAGSSREQLSIFDSKSGYGREEIWMGELRVF